MCQSSLHLNSDLISPNKLPSSPTLSLSHLHQSLLLRRLSYQREIRKEAGVLSKTKLSSFFLHALFPQGYSNILGLLLMERPGGLLFSRWDGESSVTCQWHKCLTLMQAELSHGGLLITHSNRLWIGWP